MKYLDQTIIFDITMNETLRSGIYSYSVSVPIYNTVAFRGSVYLEQGQTNISLDLTDILRSLKHSDNELTEQPKSGTGEVPYLLETVLVTLSNGNGAPGVKSEKIAFFYRYPRTLTRLQTNFSEGEVTRFCPMLQGVNVTNDSITHLLRPRIPYVSTEKMAFHTVLQIPKDTEHITWQFQGGVRYNRIDHPLVSDVIDNTTSYITITLKDLYDNTLIDNKLQSDTARLAISDKQIVADIDLCVRGYYLLWSDRYCSYQCQPFSKIDTFSTSYQPVTSLSYTNETRKVSNTVTAQWTLNSDYIPESVLPCYESLFTSENVILYDADNDESYRVTIEDSQFVEKTFINQQRKMFNLQLKVRKAVNQYVLS